MNSMKLVLLVISLSMFSSLSAQRSGGGEAYPDLLIYTGALKKF